MRKLLAFVFAVMVAATTLNAVPASATDGGSTDEGRDTSRATEPLRFVTAEFTQAQFDALRSAGFDVIDSRASRQGYVEVDLIVNGMELGELERLGVRHEVHGANAQATQRGATALATSGFNVWRTWSEPGGLADEMRDLAATYPDITKLVTFGQSAHGQDLLAIKVSADANSTRDGRKPAVMYVSLQHAREWIVGEVNRRLLHHYLEGYGTDAEVTEQVDNNELWFVLVANPDGYDYTFTEGNRLWRKTLSDNDGDGEITAFDGVDPNRNWPFRWGYDNEGSSEDPSSFTYRGTAPASEPETQALDALVRRVRPEFFVNYHSAAELLLYGNGWQVSTPEPDDNLHIALLGTDDNPAVAGYDPDPSAELYTTNGETTDHLSDTYGVMAYTPELDTCEAAEDILPDDAFGDTYCEDEGRSGFEFPDDETLIQLVFEKNLPLAMAMAASAADPNDPVSSLGLEPVDFNVDSFEVSYASRQPVAVEMKKSFRQRRMHYTVNGGEQRTVGVRRWRGGEVYGDTGTKYYAEYRGTVRRAGLGDEVTVWFTASDDGETVTSEPFTYTVGKVDQSDVLLVANEDYLGFNPEQPGVASPVFADIYTDAIRRSGRSVDVWDVSAQGVPHDLGVLSHYETIVWETGDNRLTQEADDVLIDTPFGPLPDLSVAESQQYLTIAMRDFINEGGRVLQTGEWVGFFGFFAGPLGGAYYGINGDPSATCTVTSDFFNDCLIYSDDFAQYYQGVFVRSDFGAPEAATGVGGRLDGTYTIDGTQVPNSGAFQVTSDILPEAQFPQFGSFASMEYDFAGPAPFGPFSGEYYMGALHSDTSWMRLTQEIDLTGATSAQLAFQLSYLTEGGYDHVIVEARTAGGSDYTTLPDLNGGSSPQPPTECEAGFFAALHPSLLNYLTVDGAGCTATGATGAWNSFTGDSGGWNEVAVDLSAYAGNVVEVSVSYVTDPATGGIGVFVDDATVTIDGTAATTDFEADQGSWVVSGPPADSPGNAVDWVRSTALLPPPAAAVSTDNTVTFGFGLEAVATAEERGRLMRQALRYLDSKRGAGS